MIVSNPIPRRLLSLCGVSLVVLCSVGCPPPADDVDVNMSTDPVMVDPGMSMGDNTTVMGGLPATGAMNDNTTVVTEVPAE